MSKTLTLDVVHVEIDRGKDVITADVPEHEVPVLRAIHRAPGAVRVSKDLPEDVMPTVDLDGNAFTEFDRLARKYRTKNENPVAMVYRGAHELREFGFSLGDGEAPAEAPRSMSKNHALEAAKAKKATKEAKAK